MQSKIFFFGGAVAPPGYVSTCTSASKLGKIRVFSNKTHFLKKTIAFSH